MAEDLYVSDWFVKAKRVAKEYGREWYIVSAKHGLLAPTAIIDPYDQSLDSMTPKQRDEWGSRVWNSLSGDSGNTRRSILLLAGSSYRRHIQRHLLGGGMTVEAPMTDLGIGRQLKYLNSMAQMSNLVDVRRSFYRQIDRLRPSGGDFSRLKDLRSSDVPSRGVYFFMEEGENCRLDSSARRIVRVGTHAVSQGSKSTLWQRLRAHRGLDKGGGSHRSSIFRLHVGNCIRVRDDIILPSWAKGESASKDVRDREGELEELVSDYIGNLYVAILPVLDAPGPDSDRSFLEMNSIGLLTNSVLFDIPRRSWLGNMSKVDQIRDSGLWNINYVYSGWHPRFLDILELTIDGVNELPGRISGSLAPVAWRMNRSSGNQIQLFD